MKIANPLAAWNALLGVSILVLVAALGMHFLLPSPKPKLGIKQRIAKQAAVHEETDTLKEKIQAGQNTIRTYVWPGDAKRAEAEAMALVTRIAKTHEVSLGAFRPQRVVLDQGLRRLPFALSLEGSFPDVIQFVGELETPSNRIAVQMLQMSASDSSSDQVSATMTVMAFQENLPSEKPKTPAALASNGRAAATESVAGPKTEVKAKGTPDTKGSGQRAPQSDPEPLNKRTQKASVSH